MNKSIFSKDITLKIILIVLGAFFVLIISYSSLQIFRGKGINFNSQEPIVIHPISSSYDEFEPSEKQQEPYSLPKKELIGVISVNPKTEWNIYKNKEYGFEIQYPPNWEILEHGLHPELVGKGTPFIIWHAPSNSEETAWYEVTLFIEENPKNLNSIEYVNKLIQEAENEYKAGRAPNPYYYDTIKQIKVNEIQAVALDGVFVIEGSEEIIFLANSDKMYSFEFPVAKENTNYSEPIKNNKISHQMLDTFRFID
ncbi:MAG: hypothetical protein WC650_02325 [Candidatus Doudnabacteria bacterium]